MERSKNKKKIIIVKKQKRATENVFKKRLYRPLVFNHMVRLTQKFPNLLMLKYRFHRITIRTIIIIHIVVQRFSRTL